MSNEAIRTQQISKNYGNKTVLNNVSFGVEEGTITGFIGPNGAGKTTTIKAALRLVLATYGDIHINGKSVKSDPTFNERLGSIPAEPQFPNLSVETYISDIAYLRDIPKKEILAKISRSPLSPFRYQNCNSLSTGWKKILQVFVGITLLSLWLKKTYPGRKMKLVLIMDEPFNGLDPDFRKRLFDIIVNICKEGGTVFLSTHILPDLQKMAQNVVMIKKGKIVYKGSMTADIEKTYEDHFIEKGQDRGLFEL